MARGYTTRKLEVWSLAAHLAKDRPVDYAAMFELIAAVSAQERTIRSQERAVAIVTVEVNGGKVYLVADEGPWGQPLIYDTETATESTMALGRGQIVATRTHALIDLQSRDTIVEYNQRGAKARDIALALEGIASRHGDWKSVQVDLRPKVSLGFVESIEQFERIREAGFGLGQPNLAWTDWSNQFVDLANESGAQNAGAQMAAARGESLSKVAGIVPFIKQRAKDAQASLKSAFVTGRRVDEEAETTVTLKKHTEHQRVSVKLDENRRPDESDMRRHLGEYDEALRHGP